MVLQNALLKQDEIVDITDSATMEKFSWGVPGLDLVLLVHIREDEAVMLSPTDIWYAFQPHSLPRIATEIVRRYNLSGSKLRWMFWFPDTPSSLYEWRPEWDQATKKYKPLQKIRCPQRMAIHRIPGWSANIVEIFQHAWGRLQNI